MNNDKALITCKLAYLFDYNRLIISIKSPSGAIKGFAIHTSEYMYKSCYSVCDLFFTHPFDKDNVDIVYEPLLKESLYPIKIIHNIKNGIEGEIEYTNLLARLIIRYNKNVKMHNFTIAFDQNIPLIIDQIKLTVDEMKLFEHLIDFHLSKTTQKITHSLLTEIDQIKLITKY